MTREQILKLCEFDEDEAKAFYKLCYGESVGIKKDHVIACMQQQHSQIKPIITALIDRVEQLEGALKEICKRSLSDLTWQSDGKDFGVANGALTATSPLDKLLEEE